MLILIISEMKKNYTDNPSVKDTIVFNLKTDEKNTPIQKISIYHIKRNPVKPSSTSSLEEDLHRVKSLFSMEPTSDNLKKVSAVKELKKQEELTHYLQDITLVHTIENLNSLEFEWQQEGLFPGAYLIKWEWPDHTSEETFYLESDKAVKTFVPYRYTPENKYEMLLNLYIPTTYKQKIQHNDLTPETLSKLNRCVAKGFTLLEDLANQLFDMLDANLAHDSVLPLLANFFNLTLRSSDPNQWRRQIKRAVPLYKTKGTLLGLSEALDQAGIRMIKLTKLWQIVSNFYWTDSFTVDVDHNEVLGRLTKTPIQNSYQVYLVSADQEKKKVPVDYIELIFDPNKREKPQVIWKGAAKGVYLYRGDVILIRFCINQVPDNRRTIEDYIDSLPLADLRNPLEQSYPLKNWNVKVIEEDDPLLDVVIAEKHPFQDRVVLGKIRTQFAFSEKIYNMDTYDGSLRDSYNPCDIDKDFIDVCSACQSSYFNIDLEIENPSEYKSQEAREIIKEYAPFHAILHSLNITSPRIENNVAS